MVGTVSFELGGRVIEILEPSKPPDHDNSWIIICTDLTQYASQKVPVEDIQLHDVSD